MPGITNLVPMSIFGAREHFWCFLGFKNCVLGARENILGARERFFRNQGVFPGGQGALLCQGAFFHGSVFQVPHNSGSVTSFDLVKLE